MSILKNIGLWVIKVFYWILIIVLFLIMFGYYTFSVTNWMIDKTLTLYFGIITITSALAGLLIMSAFSQKETNPLRKSLLKVGGGYLVSSLLFVTGLFLLLCKQASFLDYYILKIGLPKKISIIMYPSVEIIGNIALFLAIIFFLYSTLETIKIVWVNIEKIK